MVGIFKAYTEMTGENLDKDAVDAAMDELVTTGEIVENFGGDSQEVEAMIAELKEMLAKGEISSEEEIRKAILDLAKEHGLNLSEDDIDKLCKLLQKLKDLDIDWDGILNQAADWAKKFSDKYGDQIKDAVTSEGFWDKIAAFFDKLISWLKGLFT